MSSDNSWFCFTFTLIHGKVLLEFKSEPSLQAAPKYAIMVACIMKLCSLETDSGFTSDQNGGTGLSSSIQTLTWQNATCHACFRFSESNQMCLSRPERQHPDLISVIFFPFIWLFNTHFLLCQKKNCKCIF